MPELTVATKKRLKELAGEAKGYICSLEVIGKSLEDQFKEALDCAWRLGKVLCECKRELEYGNWLLWLEGNVPISYVHARRHMLLAEENPDATCVDDLSVESVRKFRLRYVPDKPVPELPGDQSIPRASHHLTLVNDWRKWRRQLEIGSATVNIDEARRDLRPIYEWMRQELYAEAGDGGE